MFKKIVALLMTCVLSMSLVGCSTSDSSDKTTTKKPATSNSIKIKDVNDFQEADGLIKYFTIDDMKEQGWTEEAGWPHYNSDYAIYKEMGVNPEDMKDVKSFEDAKTSKTSLYPVNPETAMSPTFSHIFQGGYSSGYYSYKWAEVLDADAFELFLEKGIFDRETARSFEKNILSAGGSEDPSILYRRFRGRDPKPEALLKRSGLIPA